MELIKQIITIISIALPLLVTTITFLLKFIGSAKSKKAAENLQRVSNIVIPYIEDAEKFLNYTGAEKKEYVMTKATKFAVKNGIPFDDNKISELIEQLVKMTKQVNKRDKDIIAEEAIKAVTL